MTLEITQAGSLAPDKTHRALRKARLRLGLRERSAAPGFAHSSTQPLSRISSQVRRTGLGSGGKDHGRKGRESCAAVQVLEWDCQVKILLSGQGIHLDLYHLTEDLPKHFMPHHSFTEDNIRKGIQRGPGAPSECFVRDYGWKGQHEVCAGGVGWFHQVLSKHRNLPCP